MPLALALAPTLPLIMIKKKVRTVNPRSDAADDASLRSSLAAAAAAMKSGDFADAMDQLKKILTDHPSHELANGMLGSVYAELGMTDQAVAAFRKTLAIHPGNPLARFQMGLVLLTAGRYQEAVDALAPMLRMEDDFLAHFHSGLALVSLQRPADARPLLLRAQERMPASHPLYPNLRQLLEQSE